MIKHRFGSGANVQQNTQSRTPLKHKSLEHAHTRQIPWGCVMSKFQPSPKTHIKTRIRFSVITACQNLSPELTATRCSWSTCSQKSHIEAVLEKPPSEHENQMKQQVQNKCGTRGKTIFTTPSPNSRVATIYTGQAYCKVQRSPLSLTIHRREKQSPNTC